MKSILRTSIFGALALGLLAFAAKPSAAQNQAPAANSDHSCYGCSVDGTTTPRAPDGHPDLNGLWNDAATGNLNPANRQFQKASDGSILFDFSTEFNEGQLCTDDSCQQPNQPPYNAEYMKKVKDIATSEFGGSTSLDPEMQCKPYGIPRGSVGGAMQIVQTPKTIAILYEGHPQPSSIYRVIYMDSPHPSDLDPTYMGDSRGHWEGDTLVVDVAGLNDETWLGGDIGGRAKYTSVHSNKEHVVERWTRKGDDILFEATVDDPLAFTHPWVLAPKRIHVDKVPGDQLLELFCTPQATGLGHFVKPDPEDLDIKTKCNYRCDRPTK